MAEKETKSIDRATIEMIEKAAKDGVNLPLTGRRR